MLISRALELGLSFDDLDKIDVAFIIEIAKQRNDDVNDDDTIEATPDMLGCLFK